MTAFSDYLEARLLDHMFMSDQAGLATISIALFTANPGETYSGASGAPEVSTVSTGYARVDKVRGSTNWTRSTNTIQNNADFTFPQATASWGTISYVGLMNSTNLLYYGALVTNRVVGSADTFKFATGDLQIAHE